MYRILYSLLFISLFNAMWCLPPLLSQEIENEVFPSGGENFTTESALELSWTVGESVVETYSDGSVLIVQGFHQPKVKITPLLNYPENKEIVSVFPNPAIDYVTVSLKGELAKTSSRIKAELYDLAGRLVYEGEIVNKEERIDIHLLANGAYVLHLKSVDEHSLLGTFKIEKYK